MVRVVHDTSSFREIAATAQAHHNSFKKYVLAQMPGLKLVLHVWELPENLESVDTHNHRWNFVSRVYAGELEAYSFRDGPPGPDTFTEYQYASPNGAEDFEMLPTRTARLETIDRNAYRAGDIYAQPFEEIHRARPTQSGTITLIAEGAVMQRSTRVFGSGLDHIAARSIVRSIQRPDVGTVRADLIRFVSVLEESAQ